MQESFISYYQIWPSENQIRLWSFWCSCVNSKMFRSWCKTNKNLEISVAFIHFMNRWRCFIQPKKRFKNDPAYTPWSRANPTARPNTNAKSAMYCSNGYLLHTWDDSRSNLLLFITLWQSKWWNPNLTFFFRVRVWYQKISI